MIYVCCSQLGCRKMMCNEHTSPKRCWPGANQNGCYSKVCVECAKPVQKKLNIWCGFWIVLIALMMGIHFLVKAAWGGWGEDEEEEDEDKSGIDDLTPVNNSGGNSSGSSWAGPASVSTLDREVFDVTNRLRTDP